MKLFANSQSPFVRKIRITLFEKGLTFETVEIRCAAQREALRQVNPRGEVPVLQDGEMIVTESSIICDYIEETYPTPPLFPSAPADRARSRTYERIADTQSDVLQFFLSLITARRPELRATHPGLDVAVHDAIAAHYTFLDRQLADRPYFLGGFSRADIAFVPHITGLVHLGRPIPDTCPNLNAWLGRMLSRPSVQEDATLALAAWQQASTDADGFFRTDWVHWRSDRVEWALRFGLGRWLLNELEAGRAYWSPAP